MSTDPETSTTEESPGTAHEGSPARPTSENLRGSCKGGVRTPDGEDGSSGVETTGDYGGGEGRASEEGLQEEIAESSGASLDQYWTTELRDGEDVRRLGGGGGGGVDDGYLTPTSPRCRIPDVLSCPPAPRKIPPKKRWRKRNPRYQDIFRVLRRRIQLSGEFELILSRVVVSPLPGSIRKDAGEEDVMG